MAIVTGEDKFGRIRLTTGECSHCGRISTVVKWTQGLSLPANIDPDSHTLIINIDKDGNFKKHGKNLFLCLNQECYARFHRQVAQIQAAGRRNH